jgi:regulator of protease activity HflC (stomatin/prohibitin superfamily)
VCPKEGIEEGVSVGSTNIFMDNNSNWRSAGSFSMVDFFVPAAVLVIFLLIIIASAIKIVREYERGVIFRLGRLVGGRGPGLFFVIPIFEKMVRVDLRTMVLDVPTQEVITRDNVPVRVDAVIYMRVIDPEKSVVQVTNFIAATSLYAQTSLRNIIGTAFLDQLLSEREELNKKLQTTVDEATDPWGIKISAVELKNVEVPDTMKRAMARQAEAERERRARVIIAQGEQQAADQLAKATKILTESPGALQLRLLGTISDVTTDKPTTVVLPVPIELMKFFES